MTPHRYHIESSLRFFLKDLMGIFTYLVHTNKQLELPIDEFGAKYFATNAAQFVFEKISKK